jgi:hypothetical protein
MLRSAGKALVVFVSRYRIAFLGLLAVLVVALAVPMVVAAVAPEVFFGRFHEVSQSYEEMQTSLHAEIECRACHAGSQGTVAYSLALVGDFYASIVSPADEPRFLEFESPTREACLACHETAWSHDIERTTRVPHPAHMSVAHETRECVECHKWTAHQETYMEEHKEMPFSGICVSYGCHVGFRSEDQCTSCHHALRDEAEDWLVEHPRVAQTIGTSSCLETCHDADQCRLCHTTGETPVFDGLQTQTGLEEIERLHVAADWSDTHGPTALEDESKCMQCHVSDGECRACHAHRPASHDPVETWISSHKDVVDPDDDVRCLTCHEQSWCDECHELFKETG